MTSIAEPQPLQSNDVASALVVDDNPEVREGLARVLRRAGFLVETAENGLAALLLLEQARYDAVVCDIMMPVLDGMRLYERLEREHPDTARRVTFVSAWFDDPGVRAFLSRTGRPILEKPFDITEFLRIVREAVDG